MTCELDVQARAVSPQSAGEDQLWSRLARINSGRGRRI